MINDIIITSSFEKNNELALENTDVGLLLSDCVYQVTVVSAQKKIYIEKNISPGLTAMADRMKLKQVFLNVLDNAVQYSAHGSAVIVAAEVHDKTIQITVTNQGNGFEIDDPDRIFRRFFKGKNSSGLGLGMYISRIIIKAHGGRITAQNVTGGAQIKIILNANI